MYQPVDNVCNNFIVLWFYAGDSGTKGDDDLLDDWLNDLNSTYPTQQVNHEY